MRIVDVIEKKRMGHALTKSEIEGLIEDYVKGEVPDYQMSAFAMAVCWRGMNDVETTALTMAMAKSGETLDLSDIPGIKVDKHSTGGVGDTTTLVLGPLLASVGVPVAKMSGRGLGHTGGTIDKLESIPGFQTQMDTEQFIEQVRTVGVAVAAQTAKLAPADKSLYALRDVTGTVASVPLISSSIMSKKLACGADAIVLDVKVGTGAFMKTLEEARVLAKTMVTIGKLAGRETVAVLTKMEQPLGYAVGNALEVKEAIHTLSGNGPEDLTDLCLTLGSEMMVLAKKAPDVETARAALQESIANGTAIEKFKAFIRAQGGNPAVVDDELLLPQAPVVKSLCAKTGGRVKAIEAHACGEVAMRLGAGRAKQTDVIDMSAGVVLHVKVGDVVSEGEVLAEVHTSTDELADAGLEELANVIEIDENVKAGDGELQNSSVVLEKITADLAALYDEELLQAAITARQHAYVPYSKFAVGAALRLADGTITSGANIENASYGLTNCAERTAIFSTVASRGHENTDIVGVAVVADSEGPVAPCGACRQVLAEFCRTDTPVILANMKGEITKTTVGELLPGAFGSSQMHFEVE